MSRLCTWGYARIATWRGAALDASTRAIMTERRSVRKDGFPTFSASKRTACAPDPRSSTGASPKIATWHTRRLRRGWRASSRVPSAPRRACASERRRARASGSRRPTAPPRIACARPRRRRRRSCAQPARRPRAPATRRSRRSPHCTARRSERGRKPSSWLSVCVGCDSKSSSYGTVLTIGAAGEARTGKCIRKRG